MPDLHHVVRQFFPGRRVSALSAFGSGNINDTFRVDIEPAVEQGAAFLLQRVNTHVFRRPEEVMANIRLVYEHLRHRSDMECLLEPITLPEGGLLYEDREGSPWRVFPFFEGMESPLHVERPEQAFRAARKIGHFLACLMDLDPDAFHHTIPDFHNSLVRLDDFNRQADQDPAGRREEVEAEVAEIRQEGPLFQQIVDLDLPRRVVHNDTKISNVLFHARTGKACGLIDWDTIMPGTVLSDFGDMVRSFVSPVGEDFAPAREVTIRFPIFRALCRGFVPELSATAEAKELDHLVLGALWITLEQAMRFLADYLAGDPYYKVAYPRHNLVRARNQLALYRQLKHHKKTLENILWEYRSP